MVLLASEVKQPMSSSPFKLQSARVLAENRERYLFVNVNNLFLQEAGGGGIPPMFLGKEIQQKGLACFMPLAKQKFHSEDEGGCWWLVFWLFFFFPCSRRKVGQDEQKETLCFSFLSSKLL